MEEPEFRSFFSANSVKRIGHARFLRNVLVAAGNSGDPELAPLVERHTAHSSPIVRGAGVWALSRIAPSRAAALADACLALEDDPEVCDEWRSAMRATGAGS